MDILENLKKLSGFIEIKNEKGSLIPIEFNVGTKTTQAGVLINATVKKIESGNRLTVIIDGTSSIKLFKLGINMFFPNSFTYSDTSKFFLNGYQSWTHTREFKGNEKTSFPLKLAMPFVKEYGDYSFYNNFDFTDFGKKGVLHSWTMTYITLTDNNIFFAGSLSENSGFTLFVHKFDKKKLEIRKNFAGKQATTNMTVLDLIFIESTKKVAFDKFFSQFNTSSKQNNTNISDNQNSIPPLTGWTSWYKHYTKITKQIILKNLEAFHKNKLPIDIFQIDDGYQSAVGDWLVTNNKFPGGMKEIADMIHSKKYKAGLWLAPFVCEKKSDLFKNHPEMIARDDLGKPISAGYNPVWSGRFYVLDLFNQKTLDYLEHVFNTVLFDYGFDLVKLDFLYAAALAPAKGINPGQAMSRAAQLLRNMCKNKLILGCGVPLGSVFKRFDYCRIGSDVSEKWDTKILKIFSVQERLSTFNSLTSTIGRTFFNARAFGNDPDVFMLRKKQCKLTKEQKLTLLVANLINGSIAFTSDNPDEYDEETMRLYKSIFPFNKASVLNIQTHDALTGVELYKINFTINSLEYVAYINLGKKKKIFYLESGFWFNAFERQFIKGDTIQPLPAYATRWFLKVKTNTFAIAGCTIHLFPGSAINRFEIKNNKIDISLHPKTINSGELYIAVPETINEIKINDILTQPKSILGHKIISIRKNLIL